MVRDGFGALGVLMLLLLFDHAAAPFWWTYAAEGLIVQAIATRLPAI